MPSRRTLAAAVAALVLLSGCSAVPGLGGGSGDAADDPEGPTHHGFTFVSDTDGAAFDATIAVRKDGETLLEESVSADGSGTYVNLSSVEATGPYTVTVNTTLPAPGGDNRSRQVELDADLGNETVVDVTYTRIRFRSFRLPRQEMEAPLQFRKRLEFPIESTVVVKHHGEVVYSDTVARNGTGPFELAELPETGVYRVAVSGSHGERWTNDTVILREPGAKLFAELDGDEPRIRVYGPGESPPAW